VAAYGQIIPKQIIDYPKNKCINIHGSLLPEYRGAVPIEAALRDGKSKTGVSLLVMTPGLDDGDVIAETMAPIEPDENAIELRTKLADLGGELLKENLLDWVEGKIEPTPQEDLAKSKNRELSITKVKDLSLDNRQISPHDSIWEANQKIKAFIDAGAAWWGINYKGQKLRLKIFEAEVEPGEDYIDSENPELWGAIVREGKKLVLYLKGGKLILRDLQLPGKTRGTGKQYLYLAYNLEKLPSSVGAGGIARNPKNGSQILGINWKPNHFGLIKGHIEEGETQKQAVIREFSEETGISKDDIQVGEYLGSYQKYGVERETWEFEKKEVHFYEVKLDSLSNLDNGEHKVGWIELEKIDEMIGRPSDRWFLKSFVLAE
jgi:methionyl-tRNA formyltransferase